MLLQYIFDTKSQKYEVWNAIKVMHRSKVYFFIKVFFNPFYVINRFDQLPSVIVLYADFVVKLQSRDALSCKIIN